MSDNIKILKNYLLYFLTLILICIIGISNVFGATISDYATKYYYYNANDNSSTNSTVYRSGDSNYVTLFGAEPPTYDNGEGFNGFYNRINYSIVKGNIYTLSLVLSYSNLLDSEFSRNDLTNRLFTTIFAHCSDCSISSVSGTYRRYANTSGSNSNTYDFSVHMSYTFVATSTTNQFYIGSYTGDDRVLGVDNHLYTSIVSVTGLTIEENNSSTIINQNDTIINQNQQMIEQNEQNTQDIIDNNNTNTDRIIEENKKNFETCEENFIDSEFVGITFLSSSSSYRLGSANSGLIFDVSQYKGKSLTLSFTDLNSSYKPRTNYCFATDKATSSSQTCISSSISSTQSTNATYNLVVPNNANYLYVIGYIDNNNKTELLDKVKLSSGIVCVNKLDEQTNAINDLNDSLNDDDSSGATSEASDFFSSFTTNTFGLTSIITAPLNLIQSLTSSTCSELHLPLPYLNNKYLDLPCMTTIYQTHFGAFFTMYQTITYGIIAYWVCVRIFNQVKDFKNPEHDEIEVVDL